MYLSWYGLGRMFIEGLRTDSLYVGVFRISQVLGFLCFVVCGSLLVWLLIRAYRTQKDSELAYESVYDKLRDKGTVTPVSGEDDAEKNEKLSEKEENDDGTAD